MCDGGKLFPKGKAHNFDFFLKHPKTVSEEKDKISFKMTNKEIRTFNLKKTKQNNLIKLVK